LQLREWQRVRRYGERPDDIHAGLQHVQMDDVAHAFRAPSYYALTFLALPLSLLFPRSQAQAIFRHGDRSPVFNAFEGSAHAGEEVARWEGRLASGLARAWRAHAFPVRNVNPRPLDDGRQPWGVLTDRGVRQATERGRRLGERYAGLVEKAFDGRPPSSSPSPSSAPVVSASSSNFARTQASCQAVLEGLLGEAARRTTGQAEASSSSSAHRNVELPRERGGADWRRAIAAAASPASSSSVLPPAPLVHIATGPSGACAIGVFDSGNGLMAAAKRMWATPAFREREATLKAESDALVAAIPFFFPPATTPQAAPAAAPASLPVTPMNDNGPAGSRFLWIRAHDYFHCTREHGFPVIPAVAHLEAVTHRQLMWRFATLFSHPGVRALATRGLLGALSRNMRAAAAGDASPAPLLHLYSGHDVTLLPLLFSLAASTATAQPITARFEGGSVVRLASADAACAAIPWPSYSSCLSFELHEEEGGGAFSVRWRFDNERHLLGEDGAAAAAAGGVHHSSHLLGLEGSLSLEALCALAKEAEELAVTAEGVGR
jgi:hypothetical protein